MKSTMFGLAALAAAICGTTAARAEAVDMSTVTCGQLLTMNEQATMFMLSWTAGYVAGTQEELSLDPDALGKMIDGTVSYCKENQEMSVLNAIKESTAQ